MSASCEGSRISDDPRVRLWAREAKNLPLLSVLLAACASAPRSDLAGRTIFQDHGIEQVREAARGALEDLAYGQWEVRAHDRRVVTEGQIGLCDRHVHCAHGVFDTEVEGPSWATIEVGLEGLGADTAVVVRIEYLMYAHCQPRYLEVECIPERLPSTGVLEDEIVEGIRARLGEGTGVRAVAESGDR